MTQRLFYGLQAMARLTGRELRTGCPSAPLGATSSAWHYAAALIRAPDLAYGLPILPATNL